jgi:hypothetical protein
MAWSCRERDSGPPPARLVPLPADNPNIDT